MIICKIVLFFVTIEVKYVRFKQMESDNKYLQILNSVYNIYFSYIYIIQGTVPVTNIF